MQKLFRNTILCLFAGPGYLINAPLLAQQVRVSASVDSINYLIGDPIAVHVSVQHPFNTVILWQPFAEDSTRIFEKLSESVTDSIEQQEFLSENKTVTYITFDTGLLRIPSFTIYYRQDEETFSTSTSPVTIFSATMPVDTAQSFRAIKPPVEVFVKRDSRWLYAVSILSIVILAFAYWYFFIHRKRKRNLIEAPVTDNRLPHEKAMDELIELEAQQLPEQQVKQYYTRLTQILRTYIETGLHIPALETTTYELIEELREKLPQKQMLGQLNDDLVLADMVKFAKAIPQEADHDRIMSTARNFIELTKPAETVAVQKEEQPV